MRAVLDGLASAVLNRYHSLPWSTASPPSTRPVRRRASSAPRPAPASAGSASARRARSRPRRPHQTVAAPARRSRRYAQLRASWRADPAGRCRAGVRSGRIRPAVASMEWARSGRRRHGPRRAPRRRRGPPEDVDRHFRRRDRRPARGGPAAGSSSAAGAASATAGPGPCPRARPTRARRPSRPPSARSTRGDRPRGPDHRPARLDRVLVRPVAGPGSTRPSTTS